MLRVPGESPGIPIYAQTDRAFPFHTDQWAAIVFYRAPECVPANFNLLDLYDIPAVFACPLTVSGFELREKGQPVEVTPRQAVSSGSAVPVWFVAWDALQAAIADDVLTMSELEALGPLKGVANTFHEVRHPVAPPGTTGGAKIPHLSIVASGFLTDGSGRSFQYEVASVEYGKVKHVRIVIR
jgi:hypothetical protein